MCTPLFVLPLVFGIGCVGDDFGRTRDMFYHQDMHQWVGAEATVALGGYPSNFPLTDDERALRDMAYYFIEPPHSRPAWKGVFDEPHRSQASSYQGLMEDVRNDLTMLDQFIPLAVKLNDMDIKRHKALGYIGDVSPREYADAQARMR